MNDFDKNQYRVQDNKYSNADYSIHNHPKINTDYPVNRGSNDYDNVWLWSIAIIVAIVILVILLRIIVNIFSQIGIFSIFTLDFLARSFKWFHVNDPAIGWLFLGLILGSFVGLAIGLRHIHKLTYARNVFASLIAIVLFLVIAAYSNWIFELDTREFKNVVLEENFVDLTDSWVLSNEDYTLNQGLCLQKGFAYWIGTSFKNVDFQAVLIKTKGNNESPFGIFFKDETSNEHYYLKINGQREFLMDKSTNDIRREGYGVRKLDFLKLGNSRNELRLIVKDQKVIAKINGRVVRITEDHALVPGHIGLIVQSNTDNQDFQVCFEKVVLKVES